MHPEFANTVTTASEVRELGRCVGSREAKDHLTAVGNKLQDDDSLSDRWWDGFNEGASNVDSAMPWFAHDEYMGRTTNLPNNDSLGFDPTALLAALADIHAHGVGVGHGDAIRAAREHRDTETEPDPDDFISDPDDPDPDEQEAYQEQVDYVAGLTYVATCLLEQFPDDDPDPDWEPA